MKKIIINLVLLLSIICTASFSYAAGAQLGAKIEVSTNVTEVSVGDKVTFTLVTRDIANAVDNGKIYAIGGKIAYDTNFFEVDGTNGITLGDTGLFNSTNAVTEGGTNGTITLKVKEGATGSSKVTFTELTASDGRLEDMETLGTATTGNQDFTISLKTEQKPEPTPPADDKTEGEEDKKEEAKPEQKPEEDKTTTGGTKLPQTGVGIGLTVALITFVVIGIFTYTKYGKLRDIK